MLKPVIDDLGLDETVTDLAGQVTVTNPTNTAFVNIAVVDGDPKQAADIANSVAESLKNVIESDLYSGDKSPVKLSIVQKAQVPTSKSRRDCPVFGCRCGARHHHRRVRRTHQGPPQH